MVTIDIFLIGLAVCSAFTGLMTEAVKKMVGTKSKFMKSNLLVAVCSVIVALIVVIVYAILSNITVTLSYLTICFVLTLLSWLCSMVGYDKVKQTIDQFIKKESE